MKTSQHLMIAILISISVSGSAKAESDDWIAAGVAASSLSLTPPIQNINKEIRLLKDLQSKVQARDHALAIFESEAQKHARIILLESEKYRPNTTDKIANESFRSRVNAMRELGAHEMRPAAAALHKAEIDLVTALMDLNKSKKTRIRLNEIPAMISRAQNKRLLLISLIGSAFVGAAVYEGHKHLGSSGNTTFDVSNSALETSVGAQDTRDSETKSWADVKH